MTIAPKCQLCGGVGWIEDADKDEMECPSCSGWGHERPEHDPLDDRELEREP